MSKANAQTKRVFISYSHDSQDHKDWVRGLGEYLTHNGIEVLLDQWDVAFGDDLAAFMEKGIRKTDRVIMVCTDAYIGKANNGTGGVGYEKTIATAEILRDGFEIRRAAAERRIPCFTSLDTARAAVESLLHGAGGYSVRPVQEYLQGL